MLLNFFLPLAHWLGLTYPSDSCTESNTVAPVSPVAPVAPVALVSPVASVSPVAPDESRECLLSEVLPDTIYDKLYPGGCPTFVYLQPYLRELVEKPLLREYCPMAPIICKITLICSQLSFGTPNGEKLINSWVQNIEFLIETDSTQFEKQVFNKYVTLWYHFDSLVSILSDRIRHLIPSDGIIDEGSMVRLLETQIEFLHIICDTINWIRICRKLINAFYH
jgi:hypothetical protein